MKITNNPKSAEWHNKRHLDNGNVIDLGEIQRRTVYVRDHMSDYDLYITIDGGLSYRICNDGDVILPARPRFFSEPDYRTHAVLVRTDVSYKIELDHCKVRKDQNEYYYNEKRRIKVSVRRGENISIYISSCVKFQKEQLHELLIKECRSFAESQEMYNEREWHEKISEILWPYGLIVSFVSSDKPTSDYRSIPSNLATRNKMREEKDQSQHASQIDHIKRVSDAETTGIEDKIKADSIKRVVELLFGLKDKDVALFEVLLRDNPEILMTLVRNKQNSNPFK